MNVGITKVKKSNGEFVYFLTEGKDERDKIASFPGFLQAALVARYLSGGGMRAEDAALALAAISEYDLEQEEKKEDPAQAEEDRKRGCFV